MLDIEFYVGACKKYGKYKNMLYREDIDDSINVDDNAENEIIMERF